LVVEPESGRTFTRAFRGYEPAAVDAHIETLTIKQQLLLDDVESLRARLRDVGDEAAGLRKEVAVLTETSPSPHAVQQRMAKMLRQAVDEVAEMEAEARAEAQGLVAAAEAEAEATERKRQQVLADMAAQREALDTEYEETKQNWPACVLTPSRSVSGCSPTQYSRLTTIVSRPAARWRRRLNSGSAFWSS
jgi:cell division septum initiation protein DivIVA